MKRLTQSMVLKVIKVLKIPEMRKVHATRQLLFHWAFEDNKDNVHDRNCLLIVLLVLIVPL